MEICVFESGGSGSNLAQNHVKKKKNDWLLESSKNYEFEKQVGGQREIPHKPQGGCPSLGPGKQEWSNYRYRRNTVTLVQSKYALAIDESCPLI